MAKCRVASVNLIWCPAVKGVVSPLPMIYEVPAAPRPTTVNSPLMASVCMFFRVTLRELTCPPDEVNVTVMVLLAPDKLRIMFKVRVPRRTES